MAPRHAWQGATACAPGWRGFSIGCSPRCAATPEGLAPPPGPATIDAAPLSPQRRAEGRGAGRLRLTACGDRSSHGPFVLLCCHLLDRQGPFLVRCHDGLDAGD
ncbi:MAG: hypothetical protein ACKO45_10545 [Cyanobium sp.]